MAADQSPARSERQTIRRWECSACRQPSYLHDGFGQRWRCETHGQAVAMVEVEYVETGPTGRRLGKAEDDA